MLQFAYWESDFNVVCVATFIHLHRFSNVSASASAAVVHTLTHVTCCVAEGRLVDLPLPRGALLKGKSAAPPTAEGPGPGPTSRESDTEAALLSHQCKMRPLPGTAAPPASWLQGCNVCEGLQHPSGWNGQTCTLQLCCFKAAERGVSRKL
jgi:hypothetical protein